MRTRMTPLLSPLVLSATDPLFSSVSVGIELARVDQPEMAIAPSIDDGAMTSLDAREEVEVMAHEVHLQCGLFGGHRLHLEPLGLHDPRLRPRRFLCVR